MQTVRQYLNKKIVKSALIRHQKLKEIKAPQIMIDRALEIHKIAKKGEIKFGGDQKTLNLIFKSEEKFIGNGGKAWYVITTENKTIHYFPSAKYGRFIKFA